MQQQPSPEQIRATLETTLPKVQKPSRYLGLERNLVRKPWDDTPLHVALAFPDAYEIGMSHQGTRILYHLINRRSDALAERAFAPHPDMAEAMTTAGIPLYSLETYHALSEFDVVGISLQSELNFINVPYLLDLAHISRRAKDRSNDEPIVLGGGPCTANPEPVAPFFDAILIGDAEESLDSILDVVRDGRTEGLTRADLLRKLSLVDGVYVPGLYRWRESEDGAPAGWETLEAETPLPVKRVWVENLSPADQPTQPIVPFAEVIQDRLGMEIMRGCTQGCRFCQAGYWYRPAREQDPATVLKRLEQQVDETGFEEVGLLSLSSADYSQIEPLVGGLAARLSERRVSVSLPSLRADAFSVDLAEAVSRVRKSGFTFAPETGSDRLRRVINKTFTNQDMLDAADAAFAKGWNLIKVYAMIGLPTETDEDLEELVILAQQLAEIGRRHRGNKAQIKVSVGCFIPKTWTPFQWQEFVPVEEQLRRIYFLKDRFRRIKGTRLTWSNPEESALEALLSRGDRRLADTLERAYELGARFDGWTDYLRLDAWKTAIAETGIDLAKELGPRDMSDTLPWDLIDAGVRKGFLRAEWRRAQREHATKDCKWGHCYRCGVPGNGEDIHLAAATLPSDSDSPISSGTTTAPAYSGHRKTEANPKLKPLTQPPLYRKYRISFSKLGDARFLSHRQLMDALERALRAARIPIRYSEGFNPHIRLSMGPALALGLEGKREVFDIDCTAPLSKHHLDSANRLLPEGIELLDSQALIQGAGSLGKMAASANYRVNPIQQFAWPGKQPDLPEKIAGAIKIWELLDDGTLQVTLNIRQQDGPTPSLRKLLEAVGAPEDDILVTRVCRESIMLAPRRPKQPSKLEED
ncbi:MAG: TIGR03960 family B12-binding radical SAM protein [bacterium]|nr:TIGR03960 family B12-binding radical SAM protein [bacterium]